MIKKAKISRVRVPLSYWPKDVHHFLDFVVIKYLMREVGIIEQIV
jgi:hypothetical protein